MIRISPVFNLGENPQAVLSTMAVILLLPTLFLFLTGCDSGGADPKEKNYAGTYTGTGTIRIVSGTLAGNEVKQFYTLKVTQSGKTVTISGSFITDGVEEEFSADTGTVSETGVFTSNNPVDAVIEEDAVCGRIEVTRGSLVFVDNELRLSGGYRTENCGRWTLSAVLKRQR